jgi:surface protein
MTIAEQITRIKNAKAAIKQAIENKGVEVGEYRKLDEYASYIDKIQIVSDDSDNSFYDLISRGGTNYRGLFAYIDGVDVDLSLYDSSSVTNMAYMFSYFGNRYSKITNIKSLDFSKVKSIHRMFQYCNITDGIDLSGVSFPEVTDAANMFANITYMKSIDLSNTDFPKLKEAQYMFNAGMSGDITSINLTGANMPSITNASYMFQQCTKITSLDLSGINFSKATTIDAIFNGNKLLVDIIGEIDCSSISNGLYYSSYYSPFGNCTSLETLYLKNIYKNVTITKNEAKWSINLGQTKVKDECLIYIINELPDLINDKGLTATDKIVLTLPPTNTLTDEQKQVARDKGWIVVN